MVRCPRDVQRNRTLRGTPKGRYRGLSKPLYSQTGVPYTIETFKAGTMDVL